MTPRLVCSILASLTLLAVACSSSVDGTAKTSGSGGSGASGSGGSGASDCPQAATMLDVSKAPGAGKDYPAPTLSAKCTDTSFVVDSNCIPPYTFVQTTPNPLTANNEHYEIPLHPTVAAKTTEIPLLGTVGFAVNGLPFFGPNEGATPVESAFGDPVYNGLMDPCQGHTAYEYHYHSMDVKCLDKNSLVAEPWMNADPPADQASPIIGWALDGFPIYGSHECADKSCSKVVVMQSGYEKVGDPKTYAWKAYAWKEHAGDATYLDECNGHTGPNGDYHYHATATFPYILGCYRGTPSGGGLPDGGMPGQDGGGMMGGPKSCTTTADCNGACPQGSVGCTCADTPMGKICIPTCNTSADCPVGPNGQQLTCTNGTCVPPMP
jgi:hypothetical protein